MSQYTLLILDNETKRITTSRVLPEPKWTNEQWESFLSTVALKFKVDKTCVVFAHDYYSEVISNCEKALKSNRGMKSAIQFFEIDVCYDKDDAIDNRLLHKIYTYEEELAHELPNPLR